MPFIPTIGEQHRFVAGAGVRTTIGLVRCVICCSNSSTPHVNLQTVLCIALLGAQFAASYLYSLTLAQSLSSSILSFDSQNPETKSSLGPFSHLAPVLAIYNILYLWLLNMFLHIPQPLFCRFVFGRPAVDVSTDEIDMERRD